jgi:hypothetical protein
VQSFNLYSLKCLLSQSGEFVRMGESYKGNSYYYFFLISQKCILIKSVKGAQPLVHRGYTKG